MSHEGPGVSASDRMAAVAADDARPVAPGELSWDVRAGSISELERELARLWAAAGPLEPAQRLADALPEAHIQARTSVLNLVVVARRPEIGLRAASIIFGLSGRHPSRTIILSPADPDGPRWVDARARAVCRAPVEGGHRICTELIYLTAGGEAGRHLDSLVTPLLIHDLPVATWWPGDIPFSVRQTFELIELSDRLIVDGSSWSGSGRDRLTHLAGLCGRRLTVCDFGLMRQARWREAIASTFDMPDFLPFLPSLKRIAVTYGTHDATGDPEGTNIIKPVYHVAWLASRLGMELDRPLRSVTGSRPRRRSREGTGGPGPNPVPGGFDARFRAGQRQVDVILRPRLSGMPGGTTLRVELLAERRGSEMRADVTAEAEAVRVRVWQDGVETMERRYYWPRRTEADLLAESIERSGPDPIATAAIRMAGALVTPLDGEGAGQ